MWEMRNTDVALYETGMLLQSERMELYHANQLTVRLEWKRAGFVTN